MATKCLVDTKCEAVGLLVTYRCNLDCKYCYIRRKQDKSMTLQMAQSILEPYLMDDGSGWLDAIFVGAETLMAIDMIKPLIEWVENGRWKRNVRFFGSTNGTLLNEDLKSWLLAHSSSLILGLSYDGLPSIQVNNRGNNAIDIDFFLRTWPQQQIQMTINSESVKYMADGVIYLLAKGAVVHPNVAYEDTDWTDSAITEYGSQLNELISYYLEHENMPLISQFRHNLKEYADNINSSDSQTQMCGAGIGYKVYDVDGESYPCHMLSPLVLGGGKLCKIREGVLSTATFAYNECRDCPFRTACPTCLACNYLYRDSFEVRDSTHCRIMKIEVFAFMKMEIERLSKKAILTPNDATEIDAIHKLRQYYNMTL